jgi:hypothetical protein
MKHKGITSSTNTARVGIVRVENIDDDALVRAQMYALLDMLKKNIRVPAAARVVVKVNLCLLLDCETGATIDPRLVRYLAEWLLERCGAREIIIAESDATALDADRAYACVGSNAGRCPQDPLPEPHERRAGHNHPRWTPV